MTFQAPLQASTVVTVAKGVRCGWCRNVVYSRARHDMRHCPCGETGVDGGTAMERTVGKSRDFVKIAVPASPDDLFADWNCRTNLRGIVPPEPRQIVIVGQAPGPRTNPDVPLDGRSGLRLAAVAGLATFGQLQKRCTLVNLLQAHPGKKGKGDGFDVAAARPSADLVLRMTRPTGILVLLGQQVGRAFGLEPRFPYLAWAGLEVPGDGRRLPAVLFPHPSGISHWWNDFLKARQASDVLQTLLARDPAGVVLGSA